MSEQKRHDYLLGLAAATIQATLRGAVAPVPELHLWDSISAESPDAARCGGAFVTLRNGGQLRGCMGTFEPRGTLPETVQIVTQSTLRDPRFAGDRLRTDELPDLTVEISILSEPRRTNDPLSLQVGTHGVLIRRGDYHGCFLPQVAIDHGWDAATFLSFCCTHKADLPHDAWRDAATEVYLFTVDEIGAQYPEAIRQLQG